jgi:hypothetical protein
VEDLAKIHEKARKNGSVLVRVEITDTMGHLHRLGLLSLPFLKEPFGVVTGVMIKRSGRPRLGSAFRLTLSDLTALSSALTEVLRKLHGDGDR